MTMIPFTCDDFSERLPDYLECDASADVIAAVESHAATCRACSALMRELGAIAQTAAMLPDLVPARDLWRGIAARIDAPVIPIAAVRGNAGAAAAGRGRRWWAHPVLAAAALVGITATVTYTMTKESIERPVAAPGVAEAPVVAGEGTTVDAVATPQLATAGERADLVGAAGASRLVDAPGANADTRFGNGRAPAAGAPASSDVVQLASYRPGETAALDSLYYREIIRLRRLLGERRGQLDASTVAVIDRNMLVIDRAIQECRAALAADPASKFLNQQLNQALETKIELLRTAATMPAGTQGE